VECRGGFGTGWGGGVGGREKGAESTPSQNFTMSKSS